MKRSKKGFAFLSILLALAMVFTTLPAKAAESTELEKAKVKRDDAKAEAGKAENEFDAAVNRLLKAEKAVDAASAQVIAATSALRGQEDEQHQAAEDARAAQFYRQSVENQLNALKKELPELQKEAQDAKAKYDALNSKSRKDAEKKLYDEKHLQDPSLWEAIEERWKKYNEELNEAEKDYNKKNAKVTAITDQIPGLEEELEAAKKAEYDANVIYAKQNSETSRADNDLANAKKKLADAKAELVAASEALVEARENMRQKAEALAIAVAEYNRLAKLEDSVGRAKAKDRLDGARAFHEKALNEVDAAVARYNKALATQAEAEAWISKVNAAFTAMDAALKAYETIMDKAQNAAGAAARALADADDASAALVNKNNRIAALNKELADDNAKLTKLQAQFDIAHQNLLTYLEAHPTATVEDAGYAELKAIEDDLQVQIDAQLELIAHKEDKLAQAKEEALTAEAIKNEASRVAANKNAEANALAVEADQRRLEWEAATAAAKALRIAALESGLVEAEEGDNVLTKDNRKDYWKENTISGLVVAQWVLDYVKAEKKNLEDARNRLAKAEAELAAAMICAAEYGLFDRPIDGLFKDADGKTRLYKNGDVNTKYTGLYLSEGRYIYLKNGVFNENYTGLYQHSKNGKFYYLKNGVWQSGYKGLYVHSINGWTYYLVNGIWQKGVDGIYTHSKNGWNYEIENGLWKGVYTTKDGVKRMSTTVKYPGQK